MYAGWLTAFPLVNVAGEMLKLGPWALGNVPESFKGRRVKAVQTRLHKINEEKREAQIARRENREADAAAGVERCWTNGRIKNKADGIPPGANPRYHIA